MSQLMFQFISHILRSTLILEVDAPGWILVGVRIRTFEIYMCEYNSAVDKLRVLPVLRSRLALLYQ